MYDQKLVRFTYTNHRGETRIRTVVPHSIVFALSAHHPGGPRWLLHAYDVEKNEMRDFDMGCVKGWASTRG